MGRKPIQLKHPDTFSLEEFMSLSARMMKRILEGMSSEHKQELIAECEERYHATLAYCTRVGVEAADSKKITRFPPAYTAMKKYAYYYTVLTGWWSEADLSAKEEALQGKSDTLEDKLQALKDRFNKYR